MAVEEFGPGHARGVTVLSGTRTLTRLGGPARLHVRVAAQRRADLPSMARIVVEVTNRGGRSERDVALTLQQRSSQGLATGQASRLLGTIAAGRLRRVSFSTRLANGATRVVRVDVRGATSSSGASLTITEPGEPTVPLWRKVVVDVFTLLVVLVPALVALNWPRLKRYASPS